MPHARRAFAHLLLVLLTLAGSAGAVPIRPAAGAVKDRYLVTVVPAVQDVDAVAADLARTHEGKLLAVWKHAVRGFWIELPAARAAKLAADPRVETMEQDAVVRTSDAGSLPTKTASHDLWHLRRISNRKPDSDPNAPYVYAYDGSEGQQPVRVYLVDTGVWKDHLEIPDTRVSPGYNATRDADEATTGVEERPHTGKDDSPADRPCNGQLVDNTGHGTQTASLVIGSSGGVAPGAHVVPVTAYVCGSQPHTTTAILVGAFNWIAANAVRPAVVSMSIYYFTEERCLRDDPECPMGSDVGVLDSAIAGVIGAGIPVIASANNQKDDACLTGPARLSRRGGLGKVISVGGTDRNDVRWINHTPSGEPGSNIGQCVDIFAPATEIRVAAPLVPGQLKNPKNDQFAVLTGTSYAAPIVAGIVARMMAEDATLWEDPPQTADRVWAALRANATELDPAASLLDNGSPNLLVYLGRLTFKNHPKSRSVAVGQATTLDVEMAGDQANLAYQWYRGESGDTGHPLNDNGGRTGHYQPSTAIAGSTNYWVRVTRGTSSEDSRTVTVKVGGCVLAAIEDPPQSQWPKVGGAAAVTATVRAGKTAACYRWEHEDMSPVMVGGDVAGGQIAAEMSDVARLNLVPSTVGSPRYRLAVRSVTSGTCNLNDPMFNAEPGCVVRSDTFQVRTCKVPARPALSYRKNDRSFVVTGADGADERVRWYHRPNVGAPWALMRLVTSTGWSIPTGEQLYVPSVQGEYRVQVVNGCGTSEPSDRFPCLKLEGRRSGENFRDATSLQNHVFPVLYGSTIVLEVRTGAPAGANLQYEWSTGTDAGDPAKKTIGPVTTDMVVKVKVTENNCTDELTFSVKAVSAECPFTILAGRCQRVLEPRLSVYKNMRATLSAEIRDANDLRVANTAATHFLWEKVVGAQRTAIHQGFGDDGDSLTYLVQDADSHDLELTVTHDNCPKKKVIPVAVYGTADRESTIPCLGRRRIVRHVVAGEPHYTFTSGETVPLSVEVQEPGFTYTWYRDPFDGPVEAIGSGAAIDVVMTGRASYWYVLTNGTEVIMSDVLATSPDSGEDEAVLISPIFQSIGGGATAMITAQLSPAERVTGDTLEYEWRRGSVYDESQPVIGRESTVILNDLSDDSDFWCRIIQKAGGVALGTPFYSPVASVAVNCTPTVGGRVIAHPEFVAADQPSLLGTALYGKLLTIYWHRVAMDGTITQMSGGKTGAINFYPTDAVTRVGAMVTDVCGTSGDVTETTVYRCVPTITRQPSAHSIVAQGATTTLTAAATPAMAGQNITISWYKAEDRYHVQPLGTGAAFITPVLPPGTTETYQAVFKAQCTPGVQYPLESQTATVEACANPVVPQTATYEWSTVPGNPVGITAYATGTELTYQWYQGASGDESRPVAGQTGDQLTVNPLTTTSYWYRVRSRGVCASNGPAVTVRVCSPPTITMPPQSVRIPLQTSTTLSVTVDASGNTEPITYQWQQRPDAATPWTNIAGATAATFTTPVVTSATQVLTYRVVVKAGVCSTESAAAEVRVCAYATVIPANPAVSYVAYNGSVSLLLPNLAPVETKQITWYRGASGDRSHPMRSGSGTNLANDTGALTQTEQYWAEFTHLGCTSRTETYTVRVCVPEVKTQPVGKTVPQGTPATLTISATPVEGQTYQWYAGAAGVTTSPVAGATGTTLSVTPQATTTYWCRVSTSCGRTADSAAATITTCAPAAISSITPSKSVPAGSTVNLEVTADGSNRTWQWYTGTSGNTASPIANATAASVSLVVNATTSYWCRVTTDGVCTKDSAATTMTVCAMPSITAQPQPQSIFPGDTATLGVAVSSPQAVTYQWYAGAAGVTTNKLQGATSASLAVQPAATTGYWVRVANGGCVADSVAATVSLCVLPREVAAQPAQTNIASGESVTLALPPMSPAVDLQVTWYRGGVGDRSAPVRSGLNASYQTPNLTQTTQYWAEFSHNGCTSRTTAYTVSVCKPAITAQPQGSMINSDQTTTLSVGASGSPLTYQWYTGPSGNTAAPIGGAVSSSLTTAPTVADTSYWVRVTGCGVSADSAAALVSICLAPSISSLTKTPDWGYGGTGQITVSATGPNLSYQWYRGASGDVSRPLTSTSATSAVLTLPLTYTDSYWVRVRSTCTNGTVRSVDSAAILYSVAPRITQQPQGTTVPSGGAATLSVVADGTYLSYQWYSGGTTANPVGTNSPTLITAPNTAQTRYWVRVTSGSGAYDNSVQATVNVCTGPTVDSFVSTVAGTDDYKLTVTVRSTQTSLVDYHWYTGTPGVPSQSLVLGVGAAAKTYWNVTTPTTYWVRVWFKDGTCYKDTAGITVP